MNDDQTKLDPDSADEELMDQKSSLGSEPEDVEDIDATVDSVGLKSDDKGPHELNSQEIITEADKNQN